MNAATLKVVTGSAGSSDTRRAYLVPKDYSSLSRPAQRLCGRLVEWEFVGYFDGERTWRHGEAHVCERDLLSKEEYRPPPSVLLILVASFACWAAAGAVIHFAFHLF